MAVLLRARMHTLVSPSDTSCPPLATTASDCTLSPVDHTTSDRTLSPVGHHFL